MEYNPQSFSSEASLQGIQNKQLPSSFALFFLSTPIWEPLYQMHRERVDQQIMRNSYESLFSSLLDKSKSPENETTKALLENRRGLLLLAEPTRLSLDSQNRLLLPPNEIRSSCKELVLACLQEVGKPALGFMALPSEKIDFPPIRSKLYFLLTLLSAQSEISSISPEV